MSTRDTEPVRVRPPRLTEPATAESGGGPAVLARPVTVRQPIAGSAALWRLLRTPASAANFLLGEQRTRGNRAVQRLLARFNAAPAATGHAASAAGPATTPAAPRSRSLALRDALRTSPPLLQRDLTNTFPIKDGTFKVNLITESHAGAKSGMKGTISFKAGDAAPDSSSIRLLQIVRLEDLGTGSDYNWTGADANKNKVRTDEDKAKGIKPGFRVDHSAAAVSPRTKKDDKAVSPYYRDYWPNAASSQDGSKQGKTVQEASLWDFPGWSQKSRYTFETAAKAADSGYIYGAVRWGFTISDPAKGTVDSEHVSADPGPSATFGAAVKKFDEFYKNPGASTAPT